MDIKTLMIGDYLRIAKDVCFKKGEIVQVRGIDADNNFPEKGLKGSVTCLRINDVERYTGGVWVDYLEPIPLTAKILEKNGFKEYDGLYRLDIAEGVFVNADFKSKEPFVSVHNTCYRATPICRYLHQLQHAMRECEIEKEIEL